MMGLGASFTMREVASRPTAMLIVTMISIRTHSLLKIHSFNRRKVSRVLYCFQSP